MVKHLDVNKDDQIITLITCSRMYGMNDRKQFVVIGRMHAHWMTHNTPKWK